MTQHKRYVYKLLGTAITTMKEGHARNLVTPNRFIPRYWQSTKFEVCTDWQYGLQWTPMVRVKKFLKLNKQLGKKIEKFSGFLVIQEFPIIL